MAAESWEQRQVDELEGAAEGRSIAGDERIVEGSVEDVAERAAEGAAAVFVEADSSHSRRKAGRKCGYRIGTASLLPAEDGRPPGAAMRLNAIAQFRRVSEGTLSCCSRHLHHSSRASSSGDIACYRTRRPSQQTHLALLREYLFQMS